MTSREALNELFVEANRCSNAPYKYTTYDLLQFCKQIKEDLEVLEILKEHLIIDNEGNVWLKYNKDYTGYVEIKALKGTVKK